MRAILVLTILAILWPVGAASADSFLPSRTYKVIAPGGKYVFVMIVSDDLETELWEAKKWWGKQVWREVRDIRAVYSKSGMYRNDGSREPLWTVDWHRDSVYVASDGIHLVRPGYRPRYAGGLKTPIRKSDLDGQEAISFFAKGALLRWYAIGELVDQPDLLPRTSMSFRWLKEAKLLDRERQYEVETLDGYRFLFDLTTGDILETNKPPRPEPKGEPPGLLTWIAYGVIAVLLIVALVLGVVGIRSLSRKLRGSC